MKLNGFKIGPELISRGIFMKNELKQYTFFLAITALLFLSLPTPSLADSWQWPKEKIYESKNQRYQFHVIPKKDIYPDMNRHKDTRPIGLLNHIDQAGKLKKIWKRRLINEVSPVSALVSSDGKYVVTLNEWFTNGYGKNVVVIYNRQGKLIKNLSLEDILSKDEIERVEKSVSSRWWEGTHRLHEKSGALILQIKLYQKPKKPISELSAKEWRKLRKKAPIIIERAIDLRSGKKDLKF